MNAFRLARLLSLREDQAKAEKIQWAQAERAARDAAAQRDAGRQRVQDAREELAADHEQLGSRSGRSMGATLSAYDALDALRDRTASDDKALALARTRALEAREPYDLRRREVEALKRLEHRWLTERHRQRRRKENREREAFINGRFASPNTESSPGSNSNSPSTAP